MFKKRVYRIIEVFSRKIFTKHSIILLILMRCKKKRFGLCLNQILIYSVYLTQTYIFSPRALIKSPFLGKSPQIYTCTYKTRGLFWKLFERTHE